ncbi:MAG TPA: hypothetical protein VFT87_05785 [Candidatus Saccharimonadales bacterium]|nr:hypothetical protein [Candidatus Saccharimonadales bacterium]
MELSRPYDFEADVPQSPSSQAIFEKATQEHLAQVQEGTAPKDEAKFFALLSLLQRRGTPLGPPGGRGLSPPDCFADLNPAYEHPQS